MKKILFTILKTALLLPLLVACSSETDSFLPGAGTEGNAIVLQFSTGDVSQSRAIEAIGAEVAVEYLDVFIFEESGGKAHYERVTNCTDKQGTVTLTAKREDFAANTGYWVYLIANSTHTTTDFDAIADLNSLKAMTQEDRDIFLTGLGDISEAPQSFLMDGIAYADAQEPAVAALVVLYNGNKSDDTNLKVTLRRAAAKVIVHINKGEKVIFDQNLEGAIPGYYLRNMPYTTSLLAGVGGEADLRTPGLVNNEYFVWTESAITVTAYAYAHEWADASLEKEVRLVVNIPMKYTDESGNETEHVSSYYQIPISKDKVLKRNTCYRVTVTVGAPGALDPSKPEELENIQYSVIDWENINVDIDGNERPIFLYVNEEEMEMHNITDDNTTLEFASSSAVSATVTRVYYIDKFGQEKDEQKSIVTVTPESGLDGHIGIHAPLPTNNTIRYIEMEVTNNDEAAPKKVKIAQYPLEYITNIQGWYSYRSDFGGTTWENYRNPTNKRVSAYNYNKNKDTWSYSDTGYGQNYTFTSKVAEEITSGGNRGKSEISYYYYRRSYSQSLSTYEIWGAGNARMYHVRITASSGKYTVGRPEITENGITDSGSDNAELVSPSFMIASQLGAVFEISSVEMAASHCKQYVEVYKDKQTGKTVHLDDWRLPTKAELEIIMEFQYKTNAAMDEVLSGDYYWSASGSVFNKNASSGGGWVAIRCVRDAYETE